MTDIQSKDHFILYTDFLDGLPIKAIRKFAGGDTYVIVYLRMLLKAQACKGYIRHQRILPTLSEEIALELGETKETVTATLVHPGKLSPHRETGNGKHILRTVPDRTGKGN